MRSLPSKFLAVVLAVSLPAVFCRCEPEPTWSPEPEGQDGTAVPHVISMRLAAKQWLARAVADGRLSLLDAAALFGELNRFAPAAPDLAIEDRHACALRPPARTDAERLCRQVVQWVEH